MARITQRPAAELASPALVAAATRIDTTTQGPNTRLATPSAWQKEAWELYKKVGEFQFATGWVANSLSRISMYAADIDPTTGRPTETPTDNDTATRIVRDIAGGPAGKAALLKKLAPQLSVPGEGWIAVIVRDTATEGQVEEWHVLSASEITKRGTRITLELEDGVDHPFNPDTDILTRVHNPDPEKSRQATSPARAALPALREIVRTTDAIDGAGKSRLSGNGIFLVPSEISMPVTEPPQADPDAPGLPAGEPVTVERSVSAQDLMVQMQEVMSMAINDQTSAAAMVPIVLKASGEHLDKIRHITFESDVTQTNLDTRDRAIRRLALSMDIPPEVLTGLGDSTHWNANLVDESAINNHLAPMMTVICDALTESILKPLLVAQGEDPNGLVVWFDTTDLTQDPDRAEDAQAAFNAGAISVETYRRELGFTDDDAPDNGPLSVAEQRQLAQRLVTQTPALLPNLAHLLGLDPPPGGWATTPTREVTP